MSIITRFREWLLRIPFVYAAITGFVVCVLAPICVEPLGEAGALVMPLFLSAWLVTCVLVLVHVSRALSGSTHMLSQFGAPVFAAVTFFAVTVYGGGSLGHWVVIRTDLQFKP